MAQKKQPPGKASAVGNSMSYGILIGFVIGGIVGYSTHNFYSMLGAGFIFGMSGGIIVGMIIDRRQRKAV